MCSGQILFSGVGGNGLPYVRFRTNESGEYERLVAAFS